MQHPEIQIIVSMGDKRYPEYDMLGAVAPCAALIITHLFVVSSRQRSIMIGEDVKNKFVAYCFIWNLAELHEVKIRNQRICQRH